MAYADAIVFSISWSLILLTLLYLFMEVVDGLLAEDIEGPPLEEPRVPFQQEFTSRNNPAAGKRVVNTNN